jgi:3-oxoadipate enol-lactonase
MATAYSNGIKIYWESIGQGPALLLISGWGASGVNWEPAFIEALATTNRVVILDNRGTGRSDKPEIRYSISQMANDCVAVLDAAKIEKADVLGASMGGLIAQELALAHHERVASLILCCTCCSWKGQLLPSHGAFARTFLGDFRKMRTEERLRLRMEMLFNDNFISNEWPRLSEHWTRVARYPTPVYSFRRQWEALINYDCCLRLSAIRIPVLVLGGDADRLNHPERLKELANRIPGAELQIYTGLGHGFIFEARDLVVKRILQFLKREHY